MMDAPAQATKEIIENYLACWSRGDISGICAHYGEDFQYHDLTSGTVVNASDVVPFLEDTFALDARSSIVFNEIIYPNDETVFVHWTESLKVPGKRGMVRIGGVELIVISGGKITSIHEFYDYRPPDPSEQDASLDAQQAEQLRKLGLQADDMEEIERRASAYLKNTDAYLDPEISLIKVADAIGSTRNQLSYVLNNVMQSSFYDWVNAHRITFVIGRMREPSARFSMISIAMEAGFNSLSGFYGAFKKQTGSTPSAYRKKLASERR